MRSLLAARESLSSALSLLSSSLPGLAVVMMAYMGLHTPKLLAFHTAVRK